MRIKLLTQDAPMYPKKYMSYKHFPDELWYIGDISLLKKSKVGIVGPRKPSQYVASVCKNFLQKLPGYDCITISGGASGIDRACHLFCLQENIPTVVVLGGSLDHALKSTKRGLLNKVIEQGGLVVSQFAPNIPPARWTYPQRNTVIALLSDVLFLPGGALGSGSMSTAKKALEHGIPTCVVPGSIFEELSSGTNKLIVENNAIAVDDFDKVFFYGKISVKERTHIQENLLIGLGEKENVLIKLCVHTIGFHELLDKTGWKTSELISSLGLLEGLGYISQVSPGEYVKTIA